ncbi:MAG: DUF2339 domain-containing protein [Planctomycetota bacterium]
MLAGGSLWSRARRGDRTRLEDHLAIALATVCVVLGPGTFGEGASLGFQYLAGAAALVAATRLTRAEGGALRIHLLAQAGVLLAVAPTAFFDTPAALGLTWCIEAAVATFLVPVAGRGRIIARLFAVALAFAGAVATFPAVLPHALNATAGTHLVAGLAALALGLGARRAFRAEGAAPDAMVFQILAIGLLGLGLRGLVLLGSPSEGADPRILEILAGASWPLAASVLAAMAAGRRGGASLAAPFGVLVLSLAHPVIGAHPGPGTDVALLNAWSGAALLHAAAFFGISVLAGRAGGGRWIREAATFAAFLMMTDVAFEQLVRFETAGGRDLIAMLVRAAAAFVSVALVRRRDLVAVGAAGVVLGVLNLGQMLLSLAETREAAPLFVNAAFLARLVGAATLPALLVTLASGAREKGHGWRLEARCSLIVLQLVVSALLAHEIAGWAHGSPELPGLGAVSPLVGRGLLSAAWALQATGLLLWGLERGDALWRRMGLGLFVIVAGKVLLFDLAALETLARVISTASVGLLMMGASYAYAKRAQAEDDEAAARLGAGLR